MDNSQLDEWEREARAAGEELHAQLGMSAPRDLSIEAGIVTEPNGTNSLDNNFLNWLLKGGHLTDEFLKV